jgi:ABC-type glycerol-3-phosphate transport system substrate-binding protein
MLREKIAIEGQGFDHQNDFIAGKCGIIESSIVSKVFMENSIDFDFGVAPLPKQVKKGVILSGSNINIFNNGDPKKIAGAWDFVKWFTSTEIGAEWSIRTTYMPVRKSSLQSEYFQKAQQKDPNLKAPYVQLEYCEFEPRLTCWFEVRDLMADHLERATLEMGPAEKYCKEMADDVNAILKHNTD